MITKTIDIGGRTLSIETGRVAKQANIDVPGCPGTTQPEVEGKARGVAGVGEVRLDLVWDPPWNPDMMSEAARLELNMM